MFHEKEVYVSLCLAVIAVMLMFWDIKANSKGKKIAMTALALSSLAMCPSGRCFLYKYFGVRCGLWIGTE